MPEIEIFLIKGMYPKCSLSVGISVYIVYRGKKYLFLGGFAIWPTK
jgi:hypothetical protein